MASKKETTDPTTKLEGRTIHWDDSRMDTSYANICNISSTKEEIALLFGTNLTWQSGQKDVTVQLNNRVVMNPFVAKRLLKMLEATIQNYEKTVGPVDIESGTGRAKG